MAINYTPVGWDTSKFVNPTIMNHMDDGIKAACDGVDALNIEMDAVDENLAMKNLKTYTSITQLNLSSDNTMDEVMEALPLNSELVYMTSKTSSTLSKFYPVPTAVAKVTYYKGSNNQRGYVKWERINGNDIVLFVNRYVDGVFAGWKRFVTENDLAQITSNDAIAKSAVYNYIKSDGSLGNIEYDLSQLASKISALENK